MRTFLALGFALLVGCAAQADDGDDVEVGAENALTETGITEGSFEAEGVLIYVNDRSVTADALRAAGVSATFTASIIKARQNADGTPRWFASMADVAKLRGASKLSFGKILAAAKAAGDVEAPGFDPPTSARLSIPDNLGHAPTSNDVTVEAGFDGKTPDEVISLVRGRLSNTVFAQNERFTNDSIKTTHKAFTIALGNFYSLGSPPSNFAWMSPTTKWTLLGTISTVNPVILQGELNGVTTFYTRQSDGMYGAIPTPKYPIIMRARIQLRPQGERVFYPQWSAKVLSGPTSTVIENP